MSAVAWALLAAVCWGLAPLLEKSGLRGVAPLAGLFYRCAGVLVGMVCLAAFVVRPQEIRAVAPRTAFLLMGGGFLASVLGQYCFYNGLKIGEVSRVVPISGSYPLIAFALGILVLGETPNALKIAGVALVVAGVWLLKIG